MVSLKADELAKNKVYPLHDYCYPSGGSEEERRKS